MGERDGSSSSLIPWYPLYRDLLYTVVFGIRGCSFCRDVRDTVVFFIPWCSCTVVFFIPGCSLYCCILYIVVFVILLYSLYRGVRYTVVFVIVGGSFYRGVRYTAVFVIPGCYSHCDDSCYHGGRYIQGLHCI